MTPPHDAQRDRRLSEAMDWLLRLDANDPAERRAFQRWCDADPENARAFDEVCRIWDSPLLRESARRQQAPAAPRRRRRWLGLATAATLVLALGASLQLDLFTRLRADYYTQAGQREAVQLPGGPQVLLNAQTALTRLESPQPRVRLLQGEAYFAAGARDAVEVEAGAVQVRGRDFVVRYLDGETEVSVRQGSADLSSPADFQRILLGAGEHVRIGPAGVERAAQPADGLDRTAWIDGRLVFEDCPLREVLAELRRYYPGWILTRDEAVATRRITGNYRLDDPVSVMRALAQVTASELHEYPALMIFD